MEINIYQKGGVSVFGIISLLFGMLVFAWVMVNVAKEVTRPLSPNKEGVTIIDEAKNAKKLLEKRNELLQQ